MTTVSMFMPNLSGTTGLTLFLRKSSDYSLVNGAGNALTESSTSGWFTATVAEAWTETLSATVVDGDGLVPAAGWLGVGATVVSDVKAELDSEVTDQLDNIQLWTHRIAATTAGKASGAGSSTETFFIDGLVQVVVSLDVSNNRTNVQYTEL